MKALFYGIDYPHAKGEWSDRNIFDYYCVCCFSTPFLYESVGGKIQKGNPSDMLVMEPGKVVYHGPRPNSNEGFVNDWIYIYGYEFEELLSRYPIPVNTAFSVGRATFLRKYIEKIKKEQTLRAVGFEEKCDCIISEMVIDICRTYRKNLTNESPYDRIESAREEMMQAPEKQWTLEEMANLSGYSQSRFSTLYKEKYGISPKQDIIDMRIAKAIQMLKYSNRPIGEIAETCGFGTIYYFSKYFKHAKGITPTEFVEKCKNRTI